MSRMRTLEEHMGMGISVLTVVQTREVIHNRIRATATGKMSQIPGHDNGAQRALPPGPNKIWIDAVEAAGSVESFPVHGEMVCVIDLALEVSKHHVFRQRKALACHRVDVVLVGRRLHGGFLLSIRTSGPAPITPKRPEVARSTLWRGCLLGCHGPDLVSQP